MDIYLNNFLADFWNWLQNCEDKHKGMLFSRVTLMQDERNCQAWVSSAGLSRMVRILSEGGACSSEVMSTMSLLLTT